VFVEYVKRCHVCWSSPPDSGAHGLVARWRPCRACGVLASPLCFRRRGDMAGSLVDARFCFWHPGYVGAYGRRLPGRDRQCGYLPSILIPPRSIGWMPAEFSDLRARPRWDRACPTAPAGRLHSATDTAAGIAAGDILFVASGVPRATRRSADLRYVLAAARDFGRRVQGFEVVVNKSTVPVGTGDRVAATITEELVKRGFSADPAERHRLGQADFAVVWDAGFSSRKGQAVADFDGPIAS